MPTLSTLSIDIAALLKVASIVLVALIARRGLWLAARQVERRLERTVADPERLAHLATLVQAGRGAVYVLVLIIAGMMLLHTLGFDIGPLLAGAGVAGLGLSLGAQTLIKDFIGGVFILFENQFSVGDTIQVGDTSGTVERITLRATYLRDLQGRRSVVPNGDIRLVSNLTADWARAVLDLNVEYQADMGKAIQALEAAAQRAGADQAVAASLLEAPQVMGWVGLNDWAVQVRLMAKTAPDKQLEVARALRKYALEAMEAAGVRLALPAQEVRLARTE